MRKFSLRSGNNVARIQAKNNYDKANAYGDDWRQFRTKNSLAEKLCKCGRAAVERDHKVSRVKGGRHTEYNVEPMCLRCHLKKHRQTLAYSAEIQLGIITKRSQLRKKIK